MKLNKLIKAAAALLVAATALAGCKFEGTKSDFKGDARDGYVSQNNAAPASKATISVSGSIAKAWAQESIITVTITGKSYIDTKSIDKAIDFYPVSDAANATSVKVRGTTALPKTIKTIDTSTSSNNDVTTVELTVDATANGKKNQIALVIDAKKLKDKAGNLVLNGNGNEKCGEESDSYIRYIAVSSYKEGDTTTVTEAVTGSNEVFAPTWSLGAFSDWDYVTDDSGKQTGALKASFTPTSSLTVNETAIYPKDFAAELDKAFVLRTIKIGEKSWKETPVTGWAWNDTDKKYEVKTDAVLEYGTRYAFLQKTNNSVKWAEAEPYYGHVPVMSYKKDKKSLTGITTYIRTFTAPEWIVVDPDNSESATASTFPTNGSVYLRSDYVTRQDAILDKAWYSDNTVCITIASSYIAKDIRFDAYNDFVIVDSKYNKIKTKAPVVYQQDDKGVYSILIELADKNLSQSGLTVWVGEGTTIKGNKVYTSQVKFGTPKFEESDVILGYAKIN